MRSQQALGINVLQPMQQATSVGRRKKGEDKLAFEFPRAPQEPSLDLFLSTYKKGHRSLDYNLKQIALRLLASFDTHPDQVW